MTTTEQSTREKELTTLLTKERHDTLHNNDYTSLAAQHDVGGACSTLMLSSSSLRRDLMTATTNTNTANAVVLDEGRLSTPALDISGLHHRGSIHGDGGREKMHAKASSAPNTSSVPEAGLHRDGEQARLVNLVRQRQLQKQQHDYEEMSTMEWMNTSFWEFWTAVVGSSSTSSVEMENKTVVFDRHEHYSDIVNPYRDEERRRMQSLNTNNSSDGVSNADTGLHHQVVQVDTSTELGNLQHKSLPIRIMVFTCQRILYILRYVVHKILNKLILRNGKSNSQLYAIQFTVDDVIKSFVLVWIGIKLSLWLQKVTVSVVVLILMFGIVFRSKIVQLDEASESKLSHVHERTIQYQQEQQQREQRPMRQITYQNQDMIQHKPSVKQSTISSSATASISQAIIDSNEKPQHLQAIHRLKTRYPNATHAECKRFYVCVKHKEDEAAQRIESWLQWRSDCGLKLTSDANASINDEKNREYNQQFIHDDQEIWNEAAKLAIQLEQSKGASIDSSVKLPQILCAYEPQIYTNATTDIMPIANNKVPPPRAKDSSRILHILPARIDITLAPAPTYSLACALYLDRRLCRNTTEKITLLCDVRGGRGWANPTPWSMLPFIQCTSSLLGKQYPERLQKFILFPMPSAAAWIWSAAQKCLDPNTASKVVVVGEEKGKRGLPERMLEFFNEDSLKLVEERRRSFMHPPRNVSEECVRAMLSC